MNLKVYLAGKITGSDWRRELFNEGLSTSTPILDNHNVKWPTLQGAIRGGFDYVGPYYSSWGHGPNDQAGSHGNDYEYVAANQDIPWKHAGDDIHVQRHIHRSCLEAIQRADVVFAWITGMDNYGTLVELGYAAGLGKVVWVGGELPASDDETLKWEQWDDLWFAWATGRQAWGSTPLEAWEECLRSHRGSLLRAMPYREYLKTAHWEETRKKALDRARYRCQACNTQDDLHVHHRTYERRGEERDDDLTVLCRSCHSRIHGLVNGRVTRMPVKA